jgi:hypothetical protein
LRTSSTIGAVEVVAAVMAFDSTCGEARSPFTDTSVQPAPIPALKIGLSHCTATMRLPPAR